MTAESAETKIARMEERLKALEEFLRAGFMRLEQLMGMERERTETRCKAREEISDDFEDRLNKLEEWREQMVGFVSQLKGAWKATAIISGIAGSIVGVVASFIGQMIFAYISKNGGG